MFDDRVASALAYTEEGVRDGYVTDTDLNLRFVAGAMVTNRAYHPDRTFTGAVYDKGGRLIESSQRHNPDDIVPADAPLLTDEEQRRARGIRFSSGLYGGILFPNFGHFLVETIARLWPLLSVTPAELLVCFHHWPLVDVDQIFANPLYAAILRAFGLGRQNVWLIQQDCSFDMLLLPDPASRYHFDMNARMADLADHVATTVAEPADATRPTPHLYLSRSRWGENARVCNESAIDDWAESRGFRVVHPQETPPGLLLRLLTQAETVVACDGSHAHLALFCRPGTRVLMLDTRSVATQFALARLRGFRTLHLPLFTHMAYDPDRRMVDAPALGPLIETALAQLYV